MKSTDLIVYSQNTYFRLDLKRGNLQQPILSTPAKWAATFVRWYGRFFFYLHINVKNHYR